MLLTSCPGCDATIHVDKPRRGSLIRCRECGATLEVISVNPFETHFIADEEWDAVWESRNREAHWSKKTRRRHREENELSWVI